MMHIPERKPVRSKMGARAAAESIYSRLGAGIPVQPKAIADALGVRVVKAPPTTTGLSGAFLITHGKPVILYNGGDGTVRQRFTIAHELGHFLLHSTAEENAVLFRDDRSSKGTSIREIQANSFAAALLMPELELRKRVPEHITAVHSDQVDELADEFRVSSQAMGYRLSDLGLYTPMF